MLILKFFCRNEAIAASSLTPSRNGTEMENHVFSKARNKEEYLGFVAKLILHVRGNIISSLVVSPQLIKQPYDITRNQE